MTTSMTNASSTSTTATTTTSATAGMRVCSAHDLEIERGRAALIGLNQIALFLLTDGSVHAVCNRDPFTGANVMSRGIVGSRGTVPTIASPLHKQVFDLRTGACLESHGKPAQDLAVWRVQRHDDDIYLLPPQTVTTSTSVAA